MSCDYLIVGSGLTGATIARLLADAGNRVQVLDRRPYAGENVADRLHESGIYIGLHGVRYFRTNSDSVWEFANRFGEFHSHRAIVRTQVEGKLENWPVAASYVRQHVGKGWKPEFTGIAMNFEEAALAMMPRAVYERFVKGYTERQWGVPATTLSAQLARRFEIREDDDPYLSPQAKYQGMPTRGYSAWIESMLQGITLELNINYLSDRRAIRPRNLTIYTGPIDEYFNFSLGRLGYRAQQRKTMHLEDVRRALPCGQVNHPDAIDGPKIRSIEWKHLMRRDLAANTRGTVLTQEVPYSPTDPIEYEHPIPDEANEDLFLDYQRIAQQESGVLFCGPLGEYRYFDVDQEIGRAMALAKRIVSNRLREAA